MKDFIENILDTTDNMTPLSGIFTAAAICAAGAGVAALVPGLSIAAGIAIAGVACSVTGGALGVLDAFRDKSSGYNMFFMSLATAGLAITTGVVAHEVLIAPALQLT